jgi:hypothetical protein
MSAFGAFIDQARTPTGDQSPPFGLLHDDATSEVVVPHIEISDIAPKTKRQSSDSLSVLSVIPFNELQRDAGLWAWLALKWFDAICPPVVNGRRKVNQRAHYIPEVDNHQRRYRHLLLAPFVVRHWAPDHNGLWLDIDVSVHGEMMEQTLSKLYLLRVRGIREAIHELYQDKNTGKIKRGLFSTKKPKKGDLRTRLPARIQQLRRTYDIDAVSGAVLLDLLGPEFTSWRTPA